MSQGSTFQNSMTSRKSVIAILNHNDDASRWLRQQLEAEGLEVVQANLTDIKRGDVDLVDFIQRNNPDVIVYDLAPPFFNAWTFYRLVRGHSTLINRDVILTTANRDAFEDSKVIDKVQVYELTGHMDEAEELVDMIDGAATRRQDQQRQQEETPSARRSFRQAG